MSITVKKISEAKGQAPLSMITAYDTLTASIADVAGIDMILVGDSLGTTALGFDSTIPVTMDMMLHHVAAVRRGAKNALVIADMPFLSYRNVDEAVANAGAFLQKAGADAVKLEGGVVRQDVISALTNNGIPVMAHLGMLPQSAKAKGYAIVGKTDETANALRDDVKAVTEAGAFSVVFECVPHKLATELTAQTPIVTIGIGAGNGCDGQVLVFADVMGLNMGHIPSFVKQYAHLGEQAIVGIKQYIEDVKARKFPAD